MPAKKASRSEAPASSSSPAAPTRIPVKKAARPAAGGREAKTATARVPKRTTTRTKAQRGVEVVAAPAPERRVTAEDIRVRAYFLAMENGGNGGSLDFWLRAERELLTGAGADD